MEIEAAIASAKRPEKTVELCLRGDLIAEVEQLERELHREMEQGSDSLAGNLRARELAEQIEALREQMAESSITLRLRGLTNPEWVQLVAAHPPREDVALDEKVWGFNYETFFPALVGACLVDVSVEQWERLYAVLTSGQFELLSNAALAVSRRKVDVPKSFSASAILRGNSTGPGSPDSSESPPAA